MKNNKIIKFNDLVKITSRHQKNKKKIVLCHGVFDLLHIGHIKHFQEAKKFGDILIVTILAREQVYLIKCLELFMMVLTTSDKKIAYKFKKKDCR